MRTMMLRALMEAIVLAMRACYGYSIEGVEFLPRQGPYLLIFNELGLMSSVAMGVAILYLALHRRMEVPVGVAVEDVWGLRALQRLLAPGRLLPVMHGVGQSTATLWASLRELRAGRIVAINPAGIMTWDGTPPPLKPGAAWVALRSGVPMVPFVATVGAYEVWPRWARRPYATGRFALRIGRPFVLPGAPAERVDDEMIERANGLIAQRMHPLVYA